MLLTFADNNSTFLLLVAFNMKATRKSNFTDEELIEQMLQTHDLSWIQVLYERYADKVFRKCLSFVKDESTAEDLTHDIFIKLYTNLSGFRHKSKFSTWLYSITYNFCIDYLRKNQKEKWVDIDDSDGSDSGNWEVETAEDLAHIGVERLSFLLDNIKREEKIILMMKYRDDLSIKEIQDVLKISESAVKMRLKRAKEKVQELYKKYYEERL